MIFVLWLLMVGFRIVVLPKNNDCKPLCDNTKITQIQPSFYAYRIIITANTNIAKNWQE
jgi:hypothetical protein